MADREDCKTCRYWSALVVRWRGGMHEFEALCLNKKGPFAGRLREGGDWCRGWDDGALGAIDNPNLPPGAYADKAKAKAGVKSRVVRHHRLKQPPRSR
jgi:hypothetical protein